MEDIDRLRLRDKSWIELPWRDEIKERPLFEGYHRIDGQWIGTGSPIPQQRVRMHLRKLSAAAHWGSEAITLYAIRRAVGTALNGE
jgi:hypothetical protein